MLNSRNSLQGIRQSTIWIFRLKELTNFLWVWYIDFYIKQISICFLFNLGKRYTTFNKVMDIHIIYGYKDKNIEEGGEKFYVCVIMKHFQLIYFLMLISFPMLIYFLTLTVTATKVLAVNLVVPSLQLDSNDPKGFFQTKWSCHFSFKTYCKSFQYKRFRGLFIVSHTMPADTVVHNHPHLQWFHVPVIEEQTFLFINSIFSRRAWEGKSNR